jgi:hypothetical protein
MKIKSMLLKLRSALLGSSLCFMLFQLGGCPTLDTNGGQCTDPSSGDSIPCSVGGIGNPSPIDPVPEGFVPSYFQYQTIALDLTGIFAPKNEPIPLGNVSLYGIWAGDLGPGANLDGSQTFTSTSNYYTGWGVVGGARLPAFWNIQWLGSASQADPLHDSCNGQIYAFAITPPTPIFPTCVIGVQMQDSPGPIAQDAYGNPISASLIVSGGGISPKSSR